VSHDEKLAEGVTRIGDTRHYRVDGDIQGQTYISVAKFFYVAKKKNLTKCRLKLINGSAKYRLAVNIDEVASSGGVGFGSTGRTRRQTRSRTMARAGDRSFQLFTLDNIERAGAAVLYMLPNFLLFADMQLAVDEAVQRARINMFATQPISNHREPPS